MKRTAAFVLCFLLMVSITGCGQKKANDNAPSNTSSNQYIPLEGWSEIPGDEGTGSNSSKKAVPGTLNAVYTPQFAKGFTIEYYYGGAKIISTNFRATANTEARKQRILIVPNGAAVPQGTSWDKRIDGNVDRVVTLASSHAGNFANLNAIDVIKGTSIAESSSFIPALTDALKSGKAKTITQKQGSTTDTTKYFDQELTVSLKPQVIFVGGMQEDVDAAKKLEESGLVCVYVGDFAEESFMGRAQWIEFFGAFIGKEKQGQDFIRDGAKQANEIVKRTEAIANKPSVLWFTKSGTGSATKWFVKTNLDYVSSFVTALGAKLVYPEGVNTNSQDLSSENFLTYMATADKMIFGVSMRSYPNAKDMTYFNIEGIIDFSNSKAFKNDDCYAVGLDWAQDTANVGEIMRGLAKVLYPDEFKDFTDTPKFVKFKQ